MDDLMHYGTPRHSGRYPWGSGDDPYQRNSSFLGYVDKMQKQGLTEKQIAEGMGITTTQLRAKKSIAKSENRKADAAMALRLKNKGMSNVAIGERMGINESSVRALLNPALKERSEVTKATADVLKENIKNKKYVDIGEGVEQYMGVSRTKLNTSIAMLEEEGYTKHYIKVEQVGNPGKYTTLKVLAAPDTTYSEVYKNKDKILMPLEKYSEDGGRTYIPKEPPRSVDSKRVQVRYAEEGGIEKDGVIELRRGVDDISLGNARYAQVRIAVDGTHYLKGMAMYSDDMPEGVDIIFNTNKHKGTPLLGDKDNTVAKVLKKDPDNPFGATIKEENELILAQRHYTDKNGDRQLSCLNIVNEEGNWGKWSKTLSSQMLSKQQPSLAKKQLGLSYDIKKEEFDTIMSLTNPAVKKKLLNSFADDCDSSSVHLKAAGLPRQATHVILPFPDMKENEVYAPNYKDGEHVVLIRFPHGGRFEIPELVVNNKHKTANNLIHNAKDAIGINSKVAERLSGADFDGDSVLVIPNDTGAVKTAPALKGLKDFDPKEAYPAYEGMARMSPKTKQLKMGDVSNLITDMTIRGATSDEIARAVRHSMVVIDAEKHNLNYKQSYIDNGIADLKEKYQGGARRGASTLISRASSEKRVPERKEGKLVTDPKTGKTKRLYIDPETGEKLYEETGRTKKVVVGIDPVTGKKIYEPGTEKVLEKSTKMAEVVDAYDLSSGTRIENIYADYANSLKSLANQARKEYLNTGSIEYSPSAKKVYAEEVDSLKASLNIALKNKPLERRAQVIANSIVSAKREDNPGMDAADLKKIKGQALQEARRRTGAGKQQIEISPRQWEAIQAGAVSNNTLLQILDNADLDKVKQLAMPRSPKGMSDAQIKRAKSMLANGYTRSEVADALGVSTSTVDRAVE